MKRLETIVKYINSNDIVADIGCDHGYLLELCIKNKQIKKGYAIDNKIGPLNSAKRNLSKYDNIIFKLSDGLKMVDETDINCVVIAGMGGMLINKIFSDSLDKFKNINKIIVCPNRNMDKVRQFLNDHEFKIVNEDIVYEDEKFYEIIIFEKGKQILTEKELFFGPILLKDKNEVFKKKWEEYFFKIKDIENKKEEMKMIKEVLYEN